MGNDPKKLRYLAFEGGGGKGAAYLGAIQALEKLEILPVKSGQIRGLAGASAGAITALLLCLGYGSKEVGELLKKKDKFNTFFDPPMMGRWRSVTASNQPSTQIDPEVRTSDDLARVVSDRLKEIGVTTWILEAVSILGVSGYGGWKGVNVPGGASLRVLGGLLGASVAFWLYMLHGGPRGVLRELAEKTESPILTAVNKNIEGYLYSVLYDRGIFPGFAVRRFFQSILHTWLYEKAVRESGVVPPPKYDAATLSFAQLKQLTGIDLRLVGANLSRQGPFYFSSRHTPDFPVAEAVAISMNIPVLFKPVQVLDKKSPGDNPCSGMWVDGGLLNNLPLHAFDDADDNPRRSADPDLRPLHPGVLALRLTDGYPPIGPPIQVPPNGLEVIMSHVGALFATVLSPSEAGQLRTPAEVAQTLDLWTYDLQTIEFAAAESKTEKPIDEARKAVLEHFAGPWN